MKQVKKKIELSKPFVNEIPNICNSIIKKLEMIISEADIKK